jgi:outer membrane immunogenic protein
MKKFLIAAAGLVALAAPALAADMAPAPVYTKAPVVVAPVYNWTGFYIGGNGGYGWTSGNTVTLVNTTGVVVPGVVGPGSASGGFGGGQIGYNWQIQRIVLGVEADIEGASIKGSSGTRVIDVAGDQALSNQNLNYFYTVRGRAGLAFDRALFYVTGGFAGGHVTDSMLITNPAVPGSSATLVDSTSRTGYVVGGGVEFAFDPHWSVKGEYQYINLGSGILSGPTAPIPGTITTTSVKDNFQTVRIGLNYKWGGPVVAKY